MKGAKFDNCKFADKTVALDGNVYINCTFTRCVLVYTGGPLPEIRGGLMEDCTFILDGAAMRTLEFMRALYTTGAKNVVDQMIQSVVNGGGDARTQGK